MKDVDITSYADDNTLNIVGENIDQVIPVLKMLQRLYLNESKS